MKETSLLKIIQVAVSKHGARVFRNNCGSFEDKTGRWVKFGVANPGGSDLIGWIPVKITQEMVGLELAIFLAIECKSEHGKTTKEQDQFISAVITAGGIAGVARSEQDAIDILG